MNHLYSLIITMLSLVPVLSGANKIRPNLIAVDPNMSKEIGAEVQAEITASVTQVIKKYENYANFWDASYGAFDDLKYAQFMALFAGDASVINDIGSTKTILHFAEYAQLVFKTLQGKGVPFELENIEIKSIQIDDTGFYVAEVALDKIIYVGLDKKDRFFQIPKGKRIKVNMSIDMPNYLIADARIQSISHRPRKGAISLLNDFYANVLEWPFISRLNRGK